MCESHLYFLLKIIPRILRLSTVGMLKFDVFSLILQFFSLQMWMWLHLVSDSSEPLYFAQFWMSFTMLSMLRMEFLALLCLTVK